MKSTIRRYKPICCRWNKPNWNLFCKLWCADLEKMKNRNVRQTEKTGCQKNRYKVKKWYRKTFKVYIHQYQTTCIYFSILYLWYHCHMDEIKSDTTPNRYATDSGLFAVSSYQIHTCRICLLLTIGKIPFVLELVSQLWRFTMHNRHIGEEQRKIWNVHFCGVSLLPQTMKWADAEQISDQHRGSPMFFWLPLDYWLCVASLETTAFLKR